MKKRTLFITIILVAAYILCGMAIAFAYTVIGGPAPLSGKGVIPLNPGSVLDDFATNSSLNKWNCVTGVFGSTLTSTTQPGYCTKSWDATGQALKLDYDVRNSTSFSGYSSQMGGGSLTSPTAYTAVSFLVKGAVGGEFFKIQLKNNSTTSYADTASTYYRNLSSVYVTDYLTGGVTTGWQKVTIPFHAFANLDGFSSMKEFVIVFEGDQSRANGIATPQGTIYIDNIQFETTAVTSVRVSYFGHKIGVCSLGGSMGNFDPAGNTYPTNPSATYSIVNSDYSSAPYSMQTQYTVNPGFAGQDFIFGGGNADSTLTAVTHSEKMGWIAVEHNFTGFSSLKFSVRSLATGQNPVILRIELVDNGGTRYVRKASVTDSWQPWIINFSEFVDANDVSKHNLEKTSIKQMNIVYEDWAIGDAGGNKVGGIYIDDIRFE